MQHTDNLENGLFSSNGSFPAGDQLLLHAEHELMGRILQWGGIGVWTWNATTGELRFTHGFMQRCGYDEEELVPMTLEKWKELLHPEDIAAVFSAFQATVDGQERDYKVRQRVRTKSGQYVTFYTLGRVMERDAEGKTLLVGGFVQDVTQLVEAETDIQRRDHLLAAANEVAGLLLRATVKDFDMTIWRVLHLLGSAAKVDRIHVWKNYTGSDGRPHATLMYEWLEGAVPAHSQWASNIAYDKTFPTWHATLSEGQCISHVVHLKSDQTDLSPKGIVSILAAPILYNGKPWGFIGFGDCHQDRAWSEAEKGVLKAVGVLIATAIHRHEIMAALEAERIMLSQMFETSPVSLAITTNGIVQRCNRRFTDDFGIGIGQPALTSYVSPTLRNEIVEEMCRKGHVIGRNVQFQKEDGSILDSLATYLPIVYEGSPSILCWSVDISELKETEKALMAAKDLAEEATRIKGEFLSRMSHELLTPMNAIVGMVHLCNQTELTEQQRDYLTTVQTASSDLLGMIHNVLDFSKADMGKLDAEEVPFNLRNLLEEVFDAFESKAKEKNLSLNMELERICGVLKGSPIRLGQVLNNLIDNAIKFTEHGGVTVSVRQGDSNESTDHIRLRFSVQDTGIGMTTEQKAALFKPFSQGDTSSTRKHGGTGLGLAISKNLIESMGGSIGVSSTPGEGSTFQFTAVFGQGK